MNKHSIKDTEREKKRERERLTSLSIKSAKAFFTSCMTSSMSGAVPDEPGVTSPLLPPAAHALNKSTVYVTSLDDETGAAVQ